MTVFELSTIFIIWIVSHLVMSGAFIADYVIWMFSHCGRLYSYLKLLRFSWTLCDIRLIGNHTNSPYFQPKWKNTSKTFLNVFFFFLENSHERFLFCSAVCWCVWKFTTIQYTIWEKKLFYKKKCWMLPLMNGKKISEIEHMICCQKTKIHIYKNLKDNFNQTTKFDTYQ